MLFYITTFGCKVNQYESFEIERLMKENGHIPSALSPDVHIINSCTVTKNSDRKLCSLVSKLKRESHDVKIVLCGCFPRAFPEKAKEIGADIVVDKVITSISFLEKLDINNKNTLTSLIELPVSHTPQTFSTQAEKTRAFLKVQDGCNRNCSYCIIPKARGEVKSRSISEITAEAEALIKAFHNEIVITGINLCAYNRDGKIIGDVVTEIVRHIDRLSKNSDNDHFGFKVCRLRLGSLEPDLIEDAGILNLANSPAAKRLCNHFHLSLQSGSDTVLSRMKRRYTTNDFKNTVSLLRESFPHCSITTDIIAGFPNESEDEFLQTVDFIGEIGFSKVHAFAFSPREGTEAFVMLNQIPKSEKTRRVNIITEKASKVRKAFFDSLVGTKREVLIEKKLSNGNAFGHTRCYTPVTIIGNHNCNRNDIITVKIISSNENGIQAIV